MVVEIARVGLGGHEINLVRAVGGILDVAGAVSAGAAASDRAQTVPDVGETNRPVASTEPHQPQDSTIRNAARFALAAALDAQAGADLRRPDVL